MFEKEVRQLINETIDGEYIGKLSVEKEELLGDMGEPTGRYLWMLLLYLDMEQRPLVMAKDGTKEEFFEFIKDEMKRRKLQFVNFNRLSLTYPNEFDDE